MSKRLDITQSVYLKFDPNKLYEGGTPQPTKVTMHSWNDGSLRIAVGTYGFAVDLDMANEDARNICRNLCDLLGFMYTDPVQEAEYYADSELFIGGGE